jgi:hypothetical protein
MLVESSSIRTTERITQPHRDTALRLLVHVGEKWRDLGICRQEGKKAGRSSRRQRCRRVLFRGHRTAHQADSEFRIGSRNKATTNAFIEGLRHATAPQPFQLTTDGCSPYLNAIDATLSDRVDYASLIKQYAGRPEAEKRYSPAVCIGCRKQSVIGSPDPAMTSTRNVERQNLTIRMQMRRLTRLTNAFSKKRANLWAAHCLHFAYYNSCRVNKTPRHSSDETNLADHVWKLSELPNG